jgi:hypothetical protein
MKISVSHSTLILLFVATIVVKHLLKPSMAQDSGFLSLASTYPENLNSQIFWNCNLGSSRLRLDNEATRLFVEEPSANVGVVHLNGADTGVLHATSNQIYTIMLTPAGFSESKIKSSSELLAFISSHAKHNSLPQCQHL